MDFPFAPSYDVIVIGASLAGLSATLSLSKQGKHVLVLERHNLPGGAATSFVRSGVEFEASLHEMMSIGPAEAPHVVREYLESHDVHLSWERIPEAYRLYSKEDGIDITLHPGKEEDGTFVAAIELEQAYPGSKEPAQRLLSLCEEVFRSVDKTNHREISILEMAKDHLDLARTAGYSAQEVFDGLGLPLIVQKAFTPYWVYVGSPLSRLPFTVYAYLIADYFVGGAYFPKETSFGMALAMAESCLRYGAQIEYRQTVDKILVEKGKIKGVRLESGKEILAPCVISGPYPETVYKKMVEPLSAVPEKALKVVNMREHSSSNFSVLLLLDGSPEEIGIKGYNLFSSIGPVDSNRFYEDQKKRGGWDLVSSTCLNFVLPDSVPKGQTMLFLTQMVLPSAFMGVDPEQYHALKRSLALDMVSHLEETVGYRLLDRIVEMEIEAPMTHSRYNGQYLGLVYGYLHTMEDSIVARTFDQEKEHFIPGLFFAGSHCPSGDGMAVNIQNGIDAARFAEKYLKKKPRSRG